MSNGILVFIEHKQALLNKTSLEAIRAGQLGGTCNRQLLGSASNTLAPDRSRYAGSDLTQQEFNVDHRALRDRAAPARTLQRSLVQHAWLMSMKTRCVAHDLLVFRL